MEGPLLLVVIDGFGLAPAGPGNAVTKAKTPVFDRLYERWPSCALVACGPDVGLPPGVMGNSEVGHLNIGAGRVVPQDVVRIDDAISSGSFSDNEAFRGAVDTARRRGGRLHLMGLYSDGKVHSAAEHVHALVDLAAEHLPPDRVYLHLFLDGRDTPPRSADGFVRTLVERAGGRATVATVSGRYYAMDRDQRWERTQLAFRAVVQGEGIPARDAADAVARAYGRGEGDEFVLPTVLEAVSGQGPLVRPHDGGVFWNFRADRARQLCRALVVPGFSGFDRDGAAAGEWPLADLHLVSMTQYEATQPWIAAFPPVTHREVLADVWSAAGKRQLHIAETEKYAHVTYFFNGGNEEPLPGEDRILVPSPRVATYDLEPQMSAFEVTDRLLAVVEGDGADAIVLNFANPDMVGHSGVIPATVRAVEVVDGLVGRLLDAVLARSGAVVITADHGNAEQMLDPATGGVHTAHTTNPVPLLVCGGPQGMRLADGGRLADVAPTALALMGLPCPEAMTGRNLLQAP